MTSAICTLFEGDYHHGLAALANSLYSHGYRGVIFAGFRGPLPPWAVPIRHNGEVMAFDAMNGLSIHFIHINTSSHFTNYKPDFMLSLWENHCPSVESLFYFDPDITVQCRWSFFEEWVDAGVALCADINSAMPDQHPIRNAWRRYFTPHGVKLSRRQDTYFNGGFVGLCVRHRDFLSVWKSILELMKIEIGDLSQFSIGDRTHCFTQPDQDALNATTMVTTEPICPVGQDGMDFQWGGGGYIMSHAVGGIKPWRQCFVCEALKGRRPSRAAQAYLKYTQYPIRLYGGVRLALSRLDLFVAKILARLTA